MRKGLRVLLVIVLICIIICVAGIIIFKIKYDKSLEPVNTEENSETIIVEIELGLSTSEISDLLEEKNVIQSSFMFKIYITLNDVGSFKAGKYEFENGKEDVPEIAEKLVNGDIYDETVKITFVEGKTLEDYAEVIEENTNNTAEDVMFIVNDREYLESLIDEYWFITNDILDSEIYYGLEGYFLPDTYIFEDADVTAKEILDVVLSYMDKFLSEYETEIENSDYSVHEILTLASVAELEAYSDEDRSTVVGVFINRLGSGMNLGSDVTAYYAFGVNMGESDLTAKQLNTENPYNTRGPNMEGKLPVGPICNPSKPAIEAALNPTESDYYYFLADKEGKVYFSKTNAEHEQIKSELEESGLWYEY